MGEAYKFPVTSIARPRWGGRVVGRGLGDLKPKHFATETQPALLSSSQLDSITHLTTTHSITLNHTHS